MHRAAARLCCVAICSGRRLAQGAKPGWEAVIFGGRSIRDLCHASKPDQTCPPPASRRSACHDRPHRLLSKRPSDGCTPADRMTANVRAALTLPYGRSSRASRSPPPSASSAGSDECAGWQCWPSRPRGPCGDDSARALSAGRIALDGSTIGRAWGCWRTALTRTAGRGW